VLNARRRAAVPPIDFAFAIGARANSNERLATVAVALACCGRLEMNPLHKSQACALRRFGRLRMESALWPLMLILASPHVQAETLWSALPPEVQSQPPIDYHLVGPAGTILFRIPRAYIAGYTPIGGNVTFIKVEADVSNLSPINVSEPHNILPNQVTVIIRNGKTIGLEDSFEELKRTDLTFLRNQDDFSVFDTKENHVMIEGKEQTFKNTYFRPNNLEVNVYFECSDQFPGQDKPVGCTANAIYNRDIYFKYDFLRSSLKNWRTFDGAARRLIQAFLLSGGN
jgi:hypothetical protein